MQSAKWTDRKFQRTAAVDYTTVLCYTKATTTRFYQSKPSFQSVESINYLMGHSHSRGLRCQTVYLIPLVTKIYAFQSVVYHSDEVMNDDE
jgi:hypothetical protein